MGKLADAVQALEARVVALEGDSRKPFDFSVLVARLDRLEKVVFFGAVLRTPEVEPRGVSAAPKLVEGLLEVEARETLRRAKKLAAWVLERVPNPGASPIELAAVSLAEAVVEDLTRALERVR